MKLAFTTLGCPRWDMHTITSKAAEYGFDGVDFRGYLGELAIYKLPLFTALAGETAAMLAYAGLEVPCFSSSARAFSTTAAEAAGHIEEVRAYAEICERFHTPFIRVFGGAIGNTPRDRAIAIAAGNLRQMAQIAQDHDVKLLLETHDGWLASADTKALMEATDSPAVGLLWDVHHPYRMLGESPATTWQTIGNWIGYTHVKDSRPGGNAERGYQLCLIGEGDIPLREIFRTLKQGGYDGYLTLEWEKMWAPEIEEPEVAFLRYVQFMRRLLSG